MESSIYTTAKIVNKSKDGVTLKVGHNVRKTDWDTFNNMFTIDEKDKFTAVLKPEFKKKAEEVNKAATDAVVTSFMVNSSDPMIRLASLSKRSEQVQKVADLMGSSLQEAMQYISTIRQSVKNFGSDFEKAGHREFIHKETPEEYKKRHHEEKLSKPEEPTNYAIGGKNLEALQKLKENMK